MLAPGEFTIGALKDAAPVSLVLPRNKYEATILVGHFGNEPAAVFLDSQYAFCFFECADNTSWKGLIIPDVRIEVDETSLFDGTSLGVIIRKSTVLGIRAKRDAGFDDGATVTLHDGLTDAGDMRASFQKWQIVVGQATEKRVLWKSAPE